MQSDADIQEWRKRLRRRLAIIADYGYPYHIRLAAVVAVQNMMTPDHYLRAESPDALLSRVLRPFDKRAYTVDRRVVQLPVRRPPVSIVDLWDA